MCTCFSKFRPIFFLFSKKKLFCEFFTKLIFFINFKISKYIKKITSKFYISFVEFQDNQINPIFFLKLTFGHYYFDLDQN